MHILEPRIGEMIRVGPDITITVLGITEREVTLSLHFPHELKIKSFDVPDDACDPHLEFSFPTDD